MSESTRALCQIIEARPFLTLTDEELMLLTYLAERHAIAHLSDPVSTTLHGRLVDETARRREFERGQRNAYDQADAALHAIRTDAEVVLNVDGGYASAIRKIIGDSIRKHGWGRDPS